VGTILTPGASESSSRLALTFGNILMLEMPSELFDTNLALVDHIHTIKYVLLHRASEALVPASASTSARRHLARPLFLFGV